MKPQTAVNPFRTRLGREIYALAALLAGTPIFVVGLISIVYLSNSNTENARQQLTQAARNYGHVIFERLLGAAGEAQAMLGSEATMPASVRFDAYVVTGADGTTRLSQHASNLPRQVSWADNGQPRLIEEDRGEPAGIILTLEVDGSRFAGRLDPDYLWGSADDHPFATDLCVLSRATAARLYCSEQLPAAAAADIASSGQSQGTFDWESADGANVIGEYWELFVPSAFDGSPFRVVASQSQAIALEHVYAFRDIYVPGLIVTFGFTLLAAGTYARRTLNPLSQLLAATQRFARRDFETRASFARDDEFKQLGDAMDGMASELDREFRAREGLAALDQLILRGEPIAVLCKAALLHSLATSPVSTVSILVMDAGSVNAATRYRMKRDRLHTRTDRITLPLATQNLLLEKPDGICVSHADMDSRVEALVAADAAASLLIPVLVNDRLCGLLVCGAPAAEALDEQTQRQMHDLNDRIAIAIDYTQKSAELHRRAFVDELTGLPNRDAFFQRIDEEIARARASGTELALMFIDLDGFKNINDTLGHVAGDEVIRQAAERIVRSIGRRGTTARLGGDEFAVVVPLVADDDPESLAAVIIEDLRQPFRIAGTDASIGASIGSSRYPRDGSTHIELLRKADAAMYRAKDAGRGQMIDYSMTMGLELDRRLRLELGLGQALARNELSIAYQPQMDLRSGRINAAEALLRWHHGELGPVSPGEFIPIAEESGQIVTLGNWVLFNACQQYRTWRERGFGIERIAINASARQLRSHEFVQRIEDCIREFELRPGELEIELTESTLVAESEISENLAAMKRLGIALSIDDFGTGYSSLSYLQKLEFDCVKIDRAFVAGLPEDRDASAIINAVVAMCHTLGKVVVAEGIETESQLRYLAKAGVDIGQGYFLGKPMSADKFFDLFMAPSSEATMTIKRITSLSA